MPATRYAVTAGSFKSFARRERKSPASIEIEILNRACMIKNLSFDLYLLNRIIISLFKRKVNSKDENSGKKIYKKEGA